MKNKRILSALLALCMIPSMLPPAVQAEETPGFSVIQLDTETAVVISEAGQTQTFSFTPAETGLYIFQATTDDPDSWANLYDSQWNLLIEGDDNPPRRLWLLCGLPPDRG